MNSSEFVNVASYSNAMEAEMARGILQENGVDAFVDGANVNTTLSHVGSALGGVKVFVRSGDSVRAKEIIESLSEGLDVSAEAWFCGRCDESIEGGFQVCWSCGSARDEVETSFPDSIAEGNKTSNHVEQDPIVKESMTTRPAPPEINTTNPYAAPREYPELAAQDIQPDTINPEAEAVLLRAWRASIIGIVILPFVAHLYSMVLLIRAATLTQTFSPIGQKRFYRTFFVNVISGLIWSYLFWQMVLWY